MTARTHWGILVALLALACSLAPQTCAAQKVLSANAGKRPADTWVQITALPEYQTWWAKNETCLDLIPSMKLLERVEVPAYQAELNQIHWYVAGTTSFVNRDHRDVLGQFFPPDTVVLAGLLVQDERLVRHELLHAMGWNYHPSVPFKFPCDVE